MTEIARLVQSETPRYVRLTNRKGEERVVDYNEFLRLQSLKRRPYVAAEPAKIHRCSACGNEGPWTDEWEWYGSIRDIDDELPIVKTCSAACKKQVKPVRKF